MLRARIFGALVTLASFAYLCVTVLRLDLDRMRSLRAEPVIGTIVLSALAYGASFTCFVAVWKLILEFVRGERTGRQFGEVYGVYAKANIAKYLPGNVMEFMFRNYLGSGRGWTQADIALSSGIEILLSVLVAATISLVLRAKRIFAALEGDGPRRASMMLLAGMSVFAVVALTRLLLSRRRRIPGMAGEAAESLLRRMWSSEFLVLCGKSYGYYSLALLSLGVTFASIFVVVFGVTLTPANLVTITSAFLVAWVLGYITPGAPGGLGVREAALVSMLSPTYGAEATVVVTVLHRLVSILGDVGVYVVGWMIGDAGGGASGEA